MTAQRANLVGFAACVCLLAYAYYAELVMHLEPCPLCIFQRVGVFILGVTFLIAALHDPGAVGRRGYAVLVVLSALATIGVALRQLYLQSLPADAVPACGAPLDLLIKYASSLGEVMRVLANVLKGSGECAQINWRFLGLAMPAWVLASAVVLGAWGLWANLRRQPPVLRF